MERRPLVISNGVVRELPQGDTVAGAVASVEGLPLWCAPVVERNIGDGVDVEPKFVYEYTDEGWLDLVVESTI